MADSTLDGLLRGPEPDPGPARGLDAIVARAAVMAGLFGGPAELHQLGRYRLRAVLGAGAHGQVFKGWDPELERSVAVKVVRDPGVDLDRYRARYAAEAQALARLSHANVVEVFDVGVEDNAVFIVMEFVDGEDLGAWVARTRPGLPALLQAFAAAGRGLAAAHRVGLTHRDFKPSNVLVGDGTVKVADFGLAHRQPPRTGEDDVTTTSPDAGTPLYMAPEQHRGEGVDARADQYAFCVALWEAATGQLPFRGTTASALLQAKEDGAAALQRGPLPRRLTAVLRRGLAPEARARFASMEALLRALEPVQGRRIGPVVMGTAAVVVSLAAFGVASTGRTSVGCDDEQGPRWGAADATAVQAAFERTGKSRAPALAEPVVAELGRYVNAWDDARSLACGGPQLQGPAARAAVRCLDRATVGFSAVVAGLTAPHPTAEVVTHGLAAVRGLPEPDDCLRPAPDVLARPPSEQEAVVEEHIVRARAMHQAGRLHAAAAEARRAIAQARGVRDGLRAEAMTELGSKLLALQHNDEAWAQLEAAYFLAEAGGDPRVAVAAAVLLVNAAVIGNRATDAQTWLRHAESNLARGGGDMELRVDVLLQKGNVEILLGRFEEALEVYDDALAEEPRGERRVYVHHNRARVFQAQANLPAAVAEMRDALQHEIASSGPEHPSIIGTRAMLANVLMQRGELDEAATQLELALGIAGAWFDEDTAVVANLHESKGMLAFAREDAEASLKHHGEALKIRRRITGPDDANIGSSLYNLGRAADLAEDPEASAAYYRQALEQLENAYGSSHPAVALVLTSLGSALRAAGRPQEAVVALRRADAIRQAIGSQPIHLADVAGTLALALMEAQAPQAEVEAAAKRANDLIVPVADELPELHAELRETVARWRGRSR